MTLEERLGTVKPVTAMVHSVACLEGRATTAAPGEHGGDRSSAWVASLLKIAASRCASARATSRPASVIR